MEIHEERIARLERYMTRVAQLSNQLADMAVDMRLSIARSEEHNLLVRDQIGLLKEQIAGSERRLSFVEERAAQHDARMEEINLKMAEFNREAVQTRNMFIRACERLGLFDDESD